MPVFHSVQEAQDYCSSHFPTSVPTVPASHSWFDPFQHLTALLVLVAVASTWIITKDGLPAVWTAIKGLGSGLASGYAWLRNKFSAKAPATIAPAQPTPTPVA